ncbi:MAG: hypothetical protein WA364_29070 [Candidatus Nitrosopolaris sp.]
MGIKMEDKAISVLTFNADCDNGLGSCDVGDKISYSNGIPHTDAIVTNKTACLNGYVDGWKQWCNTDLSLCAKFFLSNVFPGALADNESSVNICLKNASDDVPNNDSSNILSPLSKNCDGSIGETTSPTWKVFEDKSTNWRVVHSTHDNMTKQNAVTSDSNGSSPYDSGYKHGVSDAKMEKMNSTSRSLYIVQPGNNLPNHTQNFTWGYIAGYCSLQSCADKNSIPNPDSFNAGLRYGFNDWNQHGDSKPGGYECPLARTAPHSNFCNGYDAALVYENSDY